MKLTAKPIFTTIRVKKGYSINGLARDMGVNPATIVHLERQRPVRPMTARKACLCLGEDMEVLFDINNSNDDNKMVIIKQ